MNYRKLLANLGLARNWESNVTDVRVQACAEDPLGYKAVYSLKHVPETFAIGASLLAQRERNLTLSGYRVPMTQRAIAQIEKKLGKALPEKIEMLARAV